MKIRQATIADAFEIEHVHKDAFGEAEGPVVATLAKELLNGIDDDRSIAFVAESDDRVVGAIIFSPLTISGRDESRSMILAPLAVATAFQRQGNGHALVRYGLDNLKSQGIDFVLCIRRPSLLFSIWIHAKSSIGCTVQIETPRGVDDTRPSREWRCMPSGNCSLRSAFDEC
jgi:putative acetyltransferase